MKVSECRLGNLIEHKGKQFTVTRSSFVGMKLDFSTPIELTPEWLERMGGTKEDGLEIWELIIRTDKMNIIITLYKGKVGLSIEDNETEDYINFPERSIPVHELQNWVFALTGQELTIKELV